MHKVDDILRPVEMKHFWCASFSGKDIYFREASCACHHVKKMAPIYMTVVRFKVSPSIVLLDKFSLYECIFELCQDSL